jgi:DNA excision repair protein ERCC-4
MLTYTANSWNWTISMSRMRTSAHSMALCDPYYPLCGIKLVQKRNNLSTTLTFYVNSSCMSHISLASTPTDLTSYLLSYDALSFHAYLETIVESNTISTRSGGPKVHQSPWLLTDAANIIFEVAKRRCFIISALPKETVVAPQLMDIDDQDTWDLLDEFENTGGTAKRKASERPAWLPKNMNPVLEEQPKWDLLSDILLEIESEIIHLSKNINQQGTDTVLIMTSSTRSCDLIQDFLDTMDPDAESGRKGRVMMRRRLKGYLGWRGRLNTNNPATTKQAGSAGMTSRKGKEKEGDVNEALRKKDRERAEKSASRRRMRGGAPSTSSGRNTTSDKANPEVIDVDNLEDMTL